VIINSTILGLREKGGSKDRGQGKKGMRIKGLLLGGLSEVSLLALRLMEGLPDTSSHPAQMGIGVSYSKEVPRENIVKCV
jgi:hypothetical protein